MAVEVIRMMASRGFRMRGSGTSSTRSCSFPYQTLAFISISASIAVRQAPAARRAADETAASRRLTVGGCYLAAFQELFEAPEILVHFRLRILAQQLRQRGRQLAVNRTVVNAEADDGAAPVRQ